RSVAAEIEIAPPPPAPAPAPARPTGGRRSIGGGTRSRHDVCSEAGITDEDLAQLESYGLIAPRAGSGARYSANDVAIAVAAAGFLRNGIDARHLRAWRTSAEREAG